ncbi:HlyD family secretion protein [Litorilituus lipolyticus]|uniref:HlyD family secretion protein n=1 Tax=Litorilituus lipolyticus TaxID=2491017 RepID=A0A502L0S7_9GAMM|nr:biotin/lipoyl-binding protein [Litorilituus lipolyticus]TPH15911.1 HlyD family secretion protein [Litorilituus lipolyticus]
MDLLIIATYTAICITIFKVFKIPLNKWTVPTAALGGVFILSAILLLMNYNHPYAKWGKDVFVSIPIVPQISGNVKTVNVEANVLVKKGEILFTLVNDEQVIALQKAEAALISAKGDELEDDAALLAASAQVAKARADRDRTRSTYFRYKEAHEDTDNSPFTDQEVESRKQVYQADEAVLTKAIADEKRILIETQSLIGGEDSQVAQLIAARNKAQLDLDRTIIRAPVDGIATQIAIRPGVRATSLPLRSVMTFVPKEKRHFAGAFFQNSMLRLEKGIDAEVILDAVPGHVFKGKVVDVLPAMAEGEIQANGQLISSALIQKPGFAIAIIELEESLDDYKLPLGVQGQAVAINHEHDILHVSLVRRILLRMMAWLKYVYPIK